MIDVLIVIVHTQTPRFVFGENCPGCATWMSKSDITSGMQDTAEASQTRCASCKHVFAPSVEVTFSVGREQKEDRKERVHFFDKVRLEAVAKERYKQGGRKSFTITLLAEERYVRAAPSLSCASAAHETE